MCLEIIKFSRLRLSMWMNKFHTNYLPINRQWPKTLRQQQQVVNIDNCVRARASVYSMTLKSYLKNARERCIRILCTVDAHERPTKASDFKQIPDFSDIIVWITFHCLGILNKRTFLQMYSMELANQVNFCGYAKWTVCVEYEPTR